MVKEICGKKIGMTQFFDADGNQDGVTLIEVEPACILEEIEVAGKKKARIGCFKFPEVRLNKVKKAQAGYFKKLGTAAYKLIKEVAIDGEVEAKKEVGIDLFNQGDIVDVRAKTKGKGFAGGMKRHGWAGQPSSHGHTTHRRLGSAGACSYPAKIIKGINMPGHMGDKFRTAKNLEVLKIDSEKQLLFLKGNIPGSRGSIVTIKIVKANPAPKKAEETTKE